MCTTGYSTDWTDNKDQLSVNKLSINNSFQLPSFTEWMEQFQREGVEDQ